jgi:hypothetical protein
MTASFVNISPFKCQAALPAWIIFLPNSDKPEFGGRIPE